MTNINQNQLYWTITHTKNLTLIVLIHSSKNNIQGDRNRHTAKNKDNKAEQRWVKKIFLYTYKQMMNNNIQCLYASQTVSVNKLHVEQNNTTFIIQIQSGRKL